MYAVKSFGNLHSKLKAEISTGGKEEKKLDEEVTNGDFSLIRKVLVFLQREYFLALLVNLNINQRRKPIYRVAT